MSFYCPAAGVEINPSKISAVVIKFTAGLSFIVCMIAGVLLFFHQPSAHPITAPDSNWTAQDITYINPSISAEKSLIAVYGRKISGSIQIRLDFIPLIPERIELDIFTSGARQPLPLIIQNGGQLLQANQNQGQVALSPFISGQDSIVLSLTVPVAVRDPEKTSVQVITKDQPGSQNWVAYPQVGLFSSNPVPAANVILGFWNTLPSSSPAQILRRWDGAHTGPFGQRHGLKTLIDQSQKYQAPLLLLDLDQPETLSALDLLQKLSVVKQGQSTGLLILPSFEPSNYLDPLPGWANIKDSREISKASLVYHPVAENGDFLPTLCKMDLNGRCIVLKPFSNDIDRFGLSKAGKIALASKLAPSSSPTPLVLGGDLPTSPWADSFSAPAAFRYISSHPWIKIWDQYDLDLYLKYYPSTSSQLKHRIAPPRIASPYFTNNQSTALDSLTNAPPGALTTLAWNTYFNLTSLPASPQLIALRSHYFLGIGQLLIASDWAEHPYTMNQSIQIGISSLYILSNEDHFLLFDHSDGSLLFAVSQNNGTPQIIIAPTSLFAVGLSSRDTG